MINNVTNNTHFGLLRTGTGGENTYQGKPPETSKPDCKINRTIDLSEQKKNCTFTP
jgi:hypothetical protein